MIRVLIKFALLNAAAEQDVAVAGMDLGALGNLVYLLAGWNLQLSTALIFRAAQAANGEIIMPDTKSPSKSNSSEAKKTTPSKSKAKPASGSHATPAKKADK